MANAGNLASLMSLLPESSRRVSSTSSMADDDVSESNYSMKDDDTSQSAFGKLFSMVSSIKQQVEFLNHQVSFLKKTLHVSGCQCDSCMKMMNKMDNVDTSQEQSQKDEEGSQKENTSIVINSESLFPDAEPSPNLLELLNAASGENFDFAGKRGRKSKYCDANTKVMVADYAKRFGPSAAAKKFSIPPSVASYYYRKAVNGNGKNGEIASRSPNDRIDQGSNDDATSPNYLRGRGRGRPKLIGDELDAALVDYMVEMKKTRKHLSTTKTLDIAKQYIKKHSPGLLEEEGGPVNLKHTWAMKLLARVSEREQELNGGNFPPLSADVLQSFNFMEQSAEFANIMSVLVNQMNQNSENIKMDNMINNKDNAENEFNGLTEDGMNEVIKNLLANIAETAST
uniref:Uncharacterized protein n=1 Tax=Panagrolaimus sp. JU765 TaxID=591449 RepID=A0AC34QTS0_9BILA